MANPIRATDAGFPTLDSQVVDDARRATLPCAAFWRTLWRRTGSAAGVAYPMQFFWVGKPASGAYFIAVAPFALTVPAGLLGTKVYDGTLATGSALFGFRRVTVGNVISTIGDVTITPTDHFSATLPANAQINLLAGDAIIANAPAVVDATLADIAITLLLRVT